MNKSSEVIKGTMCRNFSLI